MTRFLRLKAAIPTSMEGGALEEGVVVSPALLKASERRNVARARVARSIVRAADRRRIIPATVVGSIVLVGVSLADASVQSTIPPTTPTAPETTPPTTVSSTTADEAKSELAAVARSLASDQTALSQLQQVAQGPGTASTPSAVGNAAVVMTQQPTGSTAKAGTGGVPVGTTTAATGSTSPPASSTTTSAQSTPAAPSTTTSPPVATTPATTPPAPTTTVATAPPTTQVKTGASSVG